MKKELRIYRTKDGKEPFIEWMESLKDVIGKAHITNRLDRIIFGNYGDHKSVGDGVMELRIHYGSGYRVYFTEQESTILLLLLAGRKDTQKKDIQKAKNYLLDFRERHYD